jgi:hypothetical protein
MSSQSAAKERFKFVKYLWQDATADQLGGVDRLVYRSNKLGEDLTLTNTGGGNTSSKLMETDPLTGESVEVLWRDEIAILGRSKSRTEDAYRRRDVPDVQSLRF